jgi:hypothetical protein
VKPIDQFPIFELGASLQNLRATTNNSAATSIDQLGALWNAGVRLDGLLNGTYIEVSYCREAAETLLWQLA